MAERTRDIWNDDDGEKTPRKHPVLRGLLVFFLTLIVVLGIVLVAAYRDGTGFDTLRRYFSYGSTETVSGETVFYKYGAAPSYLKKGGSVRRVTGGSLPVGLRGTPAAPDVTRVRLEEGGFLVMISDGVADPSRDEWLMDLLAGWEGEDPSRYSAYRKSQ